MLFNLIGRKVGALVDDFDPFGEVYGVARTLLALGTAMIIACRGGAWDDRRAIGVSAMLIVASGWRPRFTGVLHAGVAFALQAMQVEGGRIASLLALLLLPVTVLDDRSWHWSAPTPRRLDRRERSRRLVARACFLLLRVQVAIIYLHAALSQTAHGTAHDWVVLVGEWSVLLIGLINGPRIRDLGLAFGLTLHAGLAISHGGLPVALVMTGGLILYLRPLDQPFSSAFLQPAHLFTSRAHRTPSAE